MQDLREKLLQAGLVKSEDVARAEKERPKGRAGGGPRPRGAEGPGPGHQRTAPLEGRRGGPPRPEARAKATGPSIPKLPPLPGSKAHQREVARRQLELDRKLRETVLAGQVTLSPGDHTFYFVTRKQKLRRLELDEAQHRALETGALAVVERPDPGQIEHAVVTADCAAKVAELSEKGIRFWARDDKPIGFSQEGLEEEQAPEASETAEPAAKEATVEPAAPGASGESAAPATPAENAAPATPAEPAASEPPAQPTATGSP